MVKHSKVNQAAAVAVDDDDYWTINRRIIISINLMSSVNLMSVCACWQLNHPADALRKNDFCKGKGKPKSFPPFQASPNAISNLSSNSLRSLFTVIFTVIGAL